LARTAVFAGLLIAMPHIAAANEAVEKVAHYKGADRQAILEQGAREEGELQLFSSTGDPAITNVVNAFEQKYPFVDVTVPCCLNAPTDVVTRAVAEHRAGREEIGLVETFISGINALRSVEMLTTFETPNSAQHVDRATDPDGYYIASRSNQRGLAINTNAIAPEEVPTSWQDLLDPKWKGRITIAGGEAATGLIAYFQDTQPAEYLESFAAQEPRLIEVRARALAEMLIGGEVEISPTITKAHLSAAIEKGAPVRFVPLSPVLSISTGFGLPAESPTPHAAMLFIDFVTSQEGQQIYRDAGFELLFKELMNEEDAKLTFVFPESDPGYPERSNELTDLLTQLFR
jgi:iron(III) transport system substrate-binding protein